jgi:Holliday junction resolvase-like predicted endonuclease
MGREFLSMDKVTKFRKRAQHWEERAATAIDPETREQWRRVADAWHSAAEAAARTPPLIWEWERQRWRDD